MALFRKNSDKSSETSTEEGFVKVAKIKSLRAGIIQQAKVGKTEIALTNVNGNYYAFAAHCPHQAWPLWSGDMKGELVRCYLHRWQFNVRTGENSAPGVPVCLPTYATRVEGDYLLVNINLTPDNSLP
jgi:nitrite reductase/ring-hydroxylating ferredoxin subunit